MIMQLNSEQQQAKQHTEGALLIVAGAGSGKTRVLVERIVHLIETGISPDKILALTFTNKAAAEMKERILARTDSFVRAMTFHSFGAMVLRESGFHLGIPADFAIYDSQESDQVLKSALEFLSLGADKAEVRSYRSLISHFKNRLIGPEMLPPDKDRDPLFPKVYAAYQLKLTECKAVDFDDLLLLTFQLLTSPIGALYEEKWSHLLVDEYQDTNHAQYQIISQLAKKYGNICVVGDPDQSIYSWRGADISNILRFQTDFPSAQKITLKTNYRSSPYILRAANTLIRHNSHRLEKELVASITGGKRVGIMPCFDDREEADFVGRRIKKAYTQEKIPLHECAVLYRTNSQSRLLEEALLKLQIPYVIYGGLSFYQRKEIKDLLAFLKLLVIPFDQISFERSFFLEKKGVGKATLHKCIPTGASIFESLHHLVNVGGCTAKQRTAFADYLRIFEGLDQHLDSPHTILRQVLERSRYEAILRAEDPLNFDDRKENIAQLLKKTEEWEEEREEGQGTSHFLQEIALVSASNEHGDPASSVQLMTLHNAKGLEFDLCILTGLEEQLFPHANSFDSRMMLEEERRLCYVGMTRAKAQLILTYAKQRFLWGTPRRMTPSRFLSELDMEACEVLGTEPRAASNGGYGSSWRWQNS